MKTLQAEKQTAKPKQTGEVRMGRDVSSKKTSGNNSASDAKGAAKKEKAELQEDRASALV
jgi:hypothetical protein